MLLAETETTIRWDREEKIAHIWTNDSTTMTKMDKMVDRFPDVYRVVKRNEEATWYECPADRIRFLRPSSEAARQAARRNTQFRSRAAQTTSESEDEPGEDE